MLVVDGINVRFNHKLVFLAKDFEPPNLVDVFGVRIYPARSIMTLKVLLRFSSQYVNA